MPKHLYVLGLKRCGKEFLDDEDITQESLLMPYHRQNTLLDCNDCISRDGAMMF